MKDAGVELGIAASGARPMSHSILQIIYELFCCRESYQTMSNTTNTQVLYYMYQFPPLYTVSGYCLLCTLYSIRRYCERFVENLYAEFSNFEWIVLSTGFYPYFLAHYTPIIGPLTNRLILSFFSITKFCGGKETGGGEVRS